VCTGLCRAQPQKRGVSFGESGRCGSRRSTHAQHEGIGLAQPNCIAPQRSNFNCPISSSDAVDLRLLSIIDRLTLNERVLAIRVLTLLILTSNVKCALYQPYRSATMIVSHCSIRISLARERNAALCPAWMKNNVNLPHLNWHNRVTAPAHSHRIKSLPSFLHSLFLPAPPLPYQESSSASTSPHKPAHLQSSALLKKHISELAKPLSSLSPASLPVVSKQAASFIISVKSLQVSVRSSPARPCRSYKV
jgi:hypothetical protein